MPKNKDNKEHKTNDSSTDGKNSTCSEIYPTYGHGDVGYLRTGPYNASYFCPEVCEVRYPMYDAEIQIQMKTCIF